MEGKKLIEAAMRFEKTQKTPWVPFVGCHAGALLGITADQYLRSESHMVDGIREAIRRYRPDGIPITFDLQLEAEALGCRLAWSEQNPPAVTTHPLLEGTDIDSLTIPRADEGRLGTVLSVAATIREEFPDVALYGLLCGPFTLAVHLGGTNLFMQMCEDPDTVHRLLDFCRNTAVAVAGYYMNAGCDVIAAVDPMTSQIGPEQFTEFVSPYVRPLFDFIRQKKHLSSFFVCGQAQQNIEAMADCAPDNISIDENIPLACVRDVCRPRRISFGGNLKLTVVLLLGSVDDARKNAVECLDIGQEEGFILSPGCDLPFAVPPENIEACGILANDPYQREVVRTLKEKVPVPAKIDMAVYDRPEKVIIDVITLDSESCAPCQYMVEAVKSAMTDFKDVVEWREHKIKEPGSVAFMTALMVKNIPTVCIDGRIKFVSQIPRHDQLRAAVKERLDEKSRYDL